MPVLWKKLLRGCVVAAIWLGLWQIAAMWVGQEVLLVSPLAVLQRLWALVPTLSFWKDIFFSLARIMAGFVLAAFTGFALAALTHSVPFLRALFEPILSIVRATPVASFIILALVWMGTHTVPVFTTFLMVLPLVWGNVSAGLASTDPQLLEMGRCFGLSPWRMFTQIRLPSIKPYWQSACLTGLGLGWKAGIAAEVLGRPKLSIGTNLYNAKVYLETADLFAWTAVVVLLSVGMEYLLRRWMKRRKEQNHG